MKKPEMRPLLRDAICRLCEEGLPKNSLVVSWSTPVGGGGKMSNIILCTSCAEHIGDMVIPESRPYIFAASEDWKHIEIMFPQEHTWKYYEEMNCE